MNAVELDSKIKETFKKYFPNGFIGSSSYAMNGGMYWKAGLIGDVKDCSGGYRVNDILTYTFGIHHDGLYDSTDEIKGKLIVEFIENSFVTNPEPGSYLAMGRIKVPGRKITNTPEKILKVLDKYFSECRDMIKVQIENNNLYYQERIPKKYLEL